MALETDPDMIPASPSWGDRREGGREGGRAGGREGSEAQ
jgi:hypothetical protein